MTTDTTLEQPNPTRIQTAACACGCTFDQTQLCIPVLERWFPVQRHCPACEKLAADCRAREEQERQKRELAERWQAWCEICPPALRETAREKLPRPDLYDRVMRWQFGPRGLLLPGPTGTGKTRCIMRLCEREFMAGKSVARLTANALADYPALLMESSTKAHDFKEHLLRARILVIDDAFKAKQSERIEELIFCVVDTRTEHGRPIFATLNDTGETLKARLGTDRGEPLIRRLREFCEVIVP